MCLLCHNMSIMKDTNNNTSEKTYFGIRIDKDTEEKVSNYARKHKWSRNFAINEILNQFLSCEQ